MSKLHKLGRPPKSALAFANFCAVVSGGSSKPLAARDILCAGGRRNSDAGIMSFKSEKEGVRKARIVRVRNTPKGGLKNLSKGWGTNSRPATYVHQCQV